MELPQEQFDAVKELSEISVKIAEGRAVLSDIESATDTYLEEREQEAVKRIEQVLENSSKLLAEIGHNQDELVKYRRELDGYCAELRYFHERITRIRTDFEAYFATENEKLDAKLKEIDQLRIDNKKESSRLSVERKSLEGERRKLDKELRVVADRQAMLERGFKELTSKKKNS